TGSEGEVARDARTIRNIPPIVVAVACADDVADLPAVLKETAHRIPEKEPRSRLFAERRAKVIESRQLERRVESDIRRKRGERGGAWPHTLPRDAASEPPD